MSDGAAVEEDVFLPPDLAVVDHHHQHHQLRQDARRGVQDGLGRAVNENSEKAISMNFSLKKVPYLRIYEATLSEKELGNFNKEKTLVFREIPFTTLPEGP